MLTKLLMNQIKQNQDRGQHERVLSLCHVLRGLAPNDPQGYGEACVAYRHLGEWEQADAVVEEGLARLGEGRELLIAHGDTAMDRTHWDEALTRWARLRQAHPQEERGWLRALEALLQLERLPEARQLLAEGRKALGEHAGLARAGAAIETRLNMLLEQAQLALKEQRWQEAEQWYARLRQADPEDWRGYGEACVAYRHLGEWEQADAVVEEGMARLGEKRELLIAYGDTAMDRTHWDKALTRWARLRQVHPQEECGWVSALEALLHFERISEARQLLAESRKALGEHAGLARAGAAIETRLNMLLKQAQLALKEQRWQEAEQQYARLRQADPEDWRGYGEACVAYRHLGEWERADAVVEEGLARLGEGRELLIVYGDTAMDRMRWDEALARWSRLRQAHPQEERGWLRAAEVLARLKEYANAQRLIDQGLNLLGESNNLLASLVNLASSRAEDDVEQIAEIPTRGEAVPNNKKTVYLHIGQTKTATTTLQAFFYANKGWLRERGVDYPDCPGRELMKSQHRFLVTALGRCKLPLPPALVEWEYIKHKIRSSNQPVVLLSEEVFWHLFENRAEERPEAIGWIKEQLSEFNVKVVCYLRRQDSWLESWYNQIVKTDVSQYSKMTFGEFMAHYKQNGLLDYHATLQPWVENFGKENMLVKPFERKKFLNGDIIADFLSLLGLKVEADCIIPKNRQISLSNAACELSSIYNRTKYAKKFKVKFLDMIEEFDQTIDDKRKYIKITEAEELLREYFEPNRQLGISFAPAADNFFDDGMDGYQYGEYAGLSVEELAFFVMTLFNDEKQKIADNKRPLKLR